MAALELSAKYARNSNNLYIDYYISSQRSQIYEELGYFRKSFVSHKITAESLHHNTYLRPLFVSHYISIAGVYLKQCDLAQAKKVLDLCQKFMKNKSGQIRYSYDYNITEYLFLTGENEAAVELLLELLSLEIYKNMTLVAALLKYLWKLGRMTTALKEQYIHCYENSSGYLTFNSKLLYARLLYDKGEMKKAIVIIDEVLAYSRKEKIYFKIIEAGLFKIAILIRQNASDKLMTDLYKEAVYYGCYDKIRQPFFFERDVITAIAKKFTPALLKDFTEDELHFHKELLALCVNTKTSILSEREVEVLAALASGLTNKEIGESLCISLATVKTHILNIYRKLEVNSRIGAVAAGKQMGLL